MAGKPSMDKMAAQLEDIAKDITGTDTTKQSYAWDRIDNAVTAIADAVGVEMPDKKFVTKKERVANIINAIAEADVGGNDDYYKLLARTIEDVVIPDGITAIPSFMFAVCSKIKSITIPDSVTVIEGGAFTVASRSNGGVMFPLVANSVEEVRTSTIDGMTDGAFAGVDKIDKLILPAIKTIDDSAFGGCMGLEYIYLGPNCTSIGSGAFGGVLISCKVECGFAEGAVSGFPNSAGFAGNPADLDITYNVPAPTVEY